MSQPKLKSAEVEPDIKEPKENTHDNKPTSAEPTPKRSVPIPFWAENPNVLFHQKYLFEFFPVENMTYEQKLNSVTRTVIILTIVGFLLSKNIRLLFIGLITIGAVFILHYYHQKEKGKVESKKIIEEVKEGFENPAMAYLNENNIQSDPDKVFLPPTSHNPFGNVMMTDYDYNPNKKPAPPAFNQNVNANILKNAKQLVSDANPDQPNIADKLFKDLGDEYVFEQSLRPFNSTPSTTIPNDQNAFAEFCYGSMVSCKEGNQFACAKNMSRHTLY